ncbi:MAG: lysostaphin resistance A-like protein [Steroidobacteraceae bacterium]
MKALAWFLGLIVAGLAAIAILAYPAWLLVTPALDVPFHRVANRIGMLALLVGFILVARRLGLADRASLGFALPRPAWLAEAGIGIALGIATMLPVIALLFALGLREPRALPPDDPLAAIVFAGLVSGLVVALIEETFLRGAMYTGIARQSGARIAIVATALVYAATHFIGRYRIPAAQVDAWSGLALLGGALRSFARPLGIADAFLCLTGVGILLGVVRRYTGNIAACIGLHAGWVCVISVVRELSQRRTGHAFDGLVSDYDGIIGWLVLAWMPVIGWALVRFYARRERGRSVLAATDQRREAR